MKKSILFVDDEPAAIECSMRIIDWGALDITEMHTANSLSQAQLCLQQHPVDIILCDIEMPHGSGLELVQWIQQEKLPVEVILLTAYESFSYAKQAVSLHCVGYLLKPVDPEDLKKMVEEAIALSEQKQHYSEYRRNREVWQQRCSVMTEHFWLALSELSVPPTDSQIGQMKTKYAVQYSKDSYVTCCLFRLLNHEGYSDEQALTLLREEVGAALLTSYNEVQITAYGQNAIMTFIISQQSGAISAETLCRLAHGILQICSNKHKIAVTIYVGEETILPGLPCAVHQLRQMERSNVWAKSGVFRQSSAVFRPEEVILPDMRVWASLLDDDPTTLLVKLREYRERLAGRNIGPQFISKFYHDFFQMICSSVQAKGLHTHDLFSGTTLLEQSEESINTVESLFNWAEQLTEVCLRQNESGDESLFAKLDRYMCSHLEEPVSRTELALLMHVSPDHLTRIVKKETGVPLSEWIQQKRMEMAKEFLTQTSLPISEIAQRVGYQHFSHFSETFKRFTGSTPYQFRQKINPKSGR